MLLMVVCLELFLGDVMVLRCQHVELRVLENFVGILDLSLSLRSGFAHVGRLFHLHGFLLGLALEFSGFRVESIVESQTLAQIAELPKTERA